MIPYARIAGFLTAAAGEILQVQILSIEENSLVVRTAQPVDVIRQMKLHIYDDRGDCFDTVVLPAPVRYTCRQEAFCVIYIFQVDDEEYKAAVRKLDAQYSHYVMQKLAQDDAALAEDYTGYPAQKDAWITTDFVSQRNQWYEEIRSMCEASCENQYGSMPADSKAEYAEQGKRVNNRWSDLNNKQLEFTFELDNPELWAQYEAFPIQTLWKAYWEEHRLAQHPFAACEPTGIYIGNQFCHLLFPEWELLERMLDKAKSEHLQVTVMTAYLREDAIDAMRDLLDRLFAWCETNRMPVELVANDWGTLTLLKAKQPWLIPSMGVLLNKRRKDPRMKYKIGFSDKEKTLAKNPLNEAFYSNYLRENYGLTRFEQEACGYRIVLPEGQNRLHMPYYQTNTSQYCTLYARCHEGQRGRQRMPEQCPQYCRDYVFSYPDHLHMVGRYNSLFGYNASVMTDASVLQDYVKQGLERIVVNLM